MDLSSKEEIFLIQEEKGGTQSMGGRLLTRASQGLTPALVYCQWLTVEEILTHLSSSSL